MPEHSQRGEGSLARKLTIKQAKGLRVGQTLYHLTQRNADGTAQRWRVSGKPKTLKTRPNEVSVPVKFGLYNHDRITQGDLGLVSLTEPKARKPKVRAKVRKTKAKKRR